MPSIGMRIAGDDVVSAAPADPPARWGMLYALVLLELALTIAALAWLTGRFA